MFNQRIYRWKFSVFYLSSCILTGEREDGHCEEEEGGVGSAFSERAGRQPEEERTQEDNQSGRNVNEDDVMSGYSFEMQLDN